ncbi:bestrophin family protein [Crocinitomix catalasitica]|uniref:bestrophin family protein n=1 Tax=Crocinitomix catalasitica TaxID=184607 RepID=UPI0004802568|nr:bestrophin family ion channel [Crocinitomix catalasitica]
MIKYNPKIWFSHIITIRKSDTLFILWKELVMLTVFVFGLSYIEINYFENMKKWSELIAVYSLIGFVLSLLLVFRTNTAYDRWWEGRKKWGELLNNSRSFAIKINAAIDSTEDKTFFKRMITNYAIALKEHLRDNKSFQLLDLTPEELDKIKSIDHEPNFISNLMYQKLKSIQKRGNLSEIDYMILDTNLNSFIDVLGVCERIKNTPIPYSYSNFLKKFIFIYVITIPLAFVGSFGYYSVLVSIFIFYVLVSIEILAEEIEDPFGTDDNDLPTDDLTLKIAANVKEILS